MTTLTATRPLIRQTVCETCDDRKTVYELPPRDMCLASLSGEAECEKKVGEAELAAMASEIAAMLVCRIRHVPEQSRRELAETIRDGVDNALTDLGGRLDGEVFMALAGWAA